MKLKKIVSLGLISTLSLSILSGCSKKEDKSSEGLQDVTMVLDWTIQDYMLHLKMDILKMKD